MQFLSNYGLFLAKTVTLVIAIAAVLGLIVSLKNKGVSKEKLKIKKINEKYKEYRHLLSEKILSKSELKQLAKSEKESNKNQKKAKLQRPRVFVLHFHGDIRASAVSSLREEITAILTIANPNDEVVLCLESAGGMVNSYGLAASQLQRLRDKHIPLTVIIDKVAASGGYMMACVGKILSGRFAIVGSIGVIAQSPNFHRYLKHHNIDFEQITAGEYKRTLTLFGENTDKGREKMKEDVENIHQLFKEFIVKHRPSLNIEAVSTGEHWHGEQALILGLVDEIKTSDDYLLEASKDKDVYELQYCIKKSWVARFSSSMKMELEKLNLFTM